MTPTIRTSLRHGTAGARRWMCPIVAVVSVLLTTQALGQATDGPPPPARGEQGEERQRLEISPERLRTRLASLLEELEVSSARISGAIETLDNNGTTDEAMAAMGGSARVRRLAEFWGEWSRFSPGEGRASRPGTERGGPGDRGAERRPETLPGGEVSTEDVLAFLETHAPEFASRIRALGEQDPRRAEFFQSRLRPRVGEILAAQQQDPELGDILTREFRVSMELLDAGRRYARSVAAGDAGVSDAREQLRALAGEQVDLRLARREHEIRSLAAKIESLQTDVDQQREDRERYIDEIVERAGTGRGPDLGRPGGTDRRGPRDGRPGRTVDE